MFLVSILLLAAQAAPTSQAATAPPADKVMCRMIQEAYSRIPSRVCLKASEWDRREKETQADIRSSRNQRASGEMTH